MLRDSETAESSPRSSVGSGRLHHGAYTGRPSPMAGFTWPTHVKAPTAPPADRQDAALVRKQLSDRQKRRWRAVSAFSLTCKCL